MNTTETATPPSDDFQASPGESAFGGDIPTAQADLSVFDQDYGEIEATSYGDLPDGKYQVRVERVEVGQSQNGDPMLKWDFLVLSGAHAGRHLFKNAVITHKSLPFVKGDLELLGVQLPKFSDLPNHLDALLDQTLEVAQRTRGEYTNLYLNCRISVSAGASGFSEGLGVEPAPF